MADVAHELRDVDGVPVVWLLGDHYEDAVGESHYQTAIESAVGPKTERGHETRAVAWLEPQPENPHDPNAVRVRLQVPGSDIFVVCGYLPRDLAVVWQPALDAVSRACGGRRVYCAGLVTGGWERPKARGRKRTGSFGVKVDVPTISVGLAVRPFAVAPPVHAPALSPLAPAHAPPMQPAPPQYMAPEQYRYPPPQAYAPPPRQLAPALTPTRIGLFVLAALALFIVLFVGSAVVVGIVRAVNAPPPTAPSPAAKAPTPVKPATKPPAKR